MHDRVTPRLVRFILDAGAAVLAPAPRWTVPTLLMYAGSDRCVSPPGSAAFAAAAPKAIVQAREFAGCTTRSSTSPSTPRCLPVLTAWLHTTPEGATSSLRSKRSPR